MQFFDSRLPNRFWDKVIPEPNSGCWLWTGASVHNGYGVFRSERRAAYAHRVSYEALVSGIETQLSLDHLCRTRCCVNPAHLEPVTQRENLRRGQRGSEWGTDTHCRFGHEYTESNTEPRGDRKNGRACRECNRIKTAAYRARKAVAA